MADRLEQTPMIEPVDPLQPRSTVAPVATFLLTSETRADEIAGHVRRIGASVVQVVKHIDPSEYSRLEAQLPRGGVKRVQVVHVEGRDALELIEPYAPHVDACAHVP